MQVVEAYRVNDIVEAHCIGELLDEAGINYQLSGDCFAASYGFLGGWTMPSIVVDAKDVKRARQLIAQRLGHRLADPVATLTLRYGLRALMFNVTAIAVIFSFYLPLEQHWPTFAYGAFMLLVIANFAACIRASRK